ncbi:PadR family transcriptional regulator [Lacticaseibacillus sharpeae]|uniref:Transcription regulator PadR N-terminal domain-containing protein n=1 Tax=Lacticaseibacillus sharpeae JCM 1186 = DSM 20505 TaxID=1291052 RepID=A0A0R1ZKC2_9LACO|nr:PadR family transcriptional regulator [Lacticaseibacillus sharpeae]KRM55408.1 hypothetical protein FC18_GL001303 [Lacticaseibacillus sharpeae JCM 1186 = DSM 20505]
MDTQLKKGLIEYTVLAALSKGDSYGYQIIKDIGPLIDLTESTLYPILKRFESDNRVTTYTKVHNGRQRKYYHLTTRGLASIHRFLAEWPEVVAVHGYIRQAAKDYVDKIERGDEDGQE